MKTAVIILNYNGQKFLEQFLQIVIDHSPEAEVIIADNASQDNSVEYLHTHFPNIKCLVFKENYGYAEGYNKAIRAINAEYVVLLNSDVEVTPHWLTPLIDYLDQHPNCAGAQPKILSYAQRTHFEHAGACGGFLDLYGYPFCRGRVFSHIEQDRGQYETTTEIFWASGCSLFIRREVFLKEGGLDKDFFAHQEEIDLCWRLKSRGYSLVCIPESTIYHVGAGTLSYESPFKTYLNFRNNLTMIFKNTEPHALHAVLRARFFLDYIAMLQFALSGNLKNALAAYKGRRDYKRQKEHFSPKRAENMARSKHQELPQMLDHALLLDVYLKRKQTFSQLFKS